MTSIFRFAATLALLLGLLAFPMDGTALAQEAPATDATDGQEMPGDDAETPAIVLPAPEAPYDDRLERLSEIVGSVHYLREICGGEEEESEWRGMMSALIEAEAPEAYRKQRLTAAFNRGYRSFASVYTDCTPAASAAEARYRSEGATLASEIIARFGN
jgi:uncharacterized protein (TIGR02301 family)